MNLGNTIQLPGIMGVQGLDCSIPSSDNTRRVKVYLVPPTISEDQYYVSVTECGATENIPSCRGKDVLLLADYILPENGEVIINYINEELQNA